MQVRNARSWALAVALVATLAASFASCAQVPEGRFVQKGQFTAVQTATGVLYDTVTNAYGETIELRLDVWEPEGDTREVRPLVIWEFGGTWVFGDRTQLAAYAQDSASRGYVAVTIDYRKERSGELDFLRATENATQDTWSAIDFLKTKAHDYRIDPNAIIVGGYSAGAINAINSVTFAGDPNRPWAPAESPVAGVISLAGSGFAFGKAGYAPIFMATGDADTTVGTQSQIDFCNGYKALGNICEQHIYAGADHISMTQNTADYLDKAHEFIWRTVLGPRGGYYN